MDALALYGAVIGTVAAVGTLLQAIWNIHRERPRLKVQGSRAVIVSGASPALNMPGQRETVIMVEAVNTGSRPITIQEAGLILKNKSKLAFFGSGRELPKELATGQQFSIWTPTEQLAHSFDDSVPAYAYCRDAEGKMHKGRLHEYFWIWYRNERQQES